MLHVEIMEKRVTDSLIWFQHFSHDNKTFVYLIIITLGPMLKIAFHWAP